MSLFWRKKSFKPLKITLKNKGGRSSSGKISVYHRGGGSTRVQRHLDYARFVYNVPAIVLRIEYDPLRHISLALICYSNGILAYIPLPENCGVGSRILNLCFFTGKAGLGNAMPVGSLPVGSFVHNVEPRPLSGAKLLRARGAYGRVMSKEHNQVGLKLRSGEIIKLPKSCSGVYGTLAYSVFNKKIHNKAGFFRIKGWRPVVRGVAMNPVDHPHGGGEGKSGTGRPSVSRWGWLTKNVKKKG